MFESGVAELDAQATVRGVRASLEAVRRHEADVLRLAAHWADLHAPQAAQGVRMPAERALTFGGDGTPEVAEFAPAELGPEIGSSLYQAQALIADALDLRHRLPCIWARVLDLRVEVWRARFVARRTRELTAEAAGHIDRTLADALETVPWSRFTDLLAAQMLRADPRRAQRLAELAARSRFVCTGRSTEHGLKGVSGRLDAPDAIWLDGMLNRLADILSTAPRPIPGVPRRDARTRDEWRAVALAVLARPLLAAKILLDHEQPDLLEVIATERDEPEPSEPDSPAFPPPAPTSAQAGARDSALRRLLRGLHPERLGSAAVLHVHISRNAIAGAACSDDRPAGGSGGAEPPAAEPGPGPGSGDVRGSNARDPGGSGGLGRGAGVARIEELGPALLAQVRDWLGPGCRIRLQPVIDPDSVAPVDGYEIPPRMRDALLARTPASVFPYGTNRSRGMDLDHTVAWTPGLSAQTGLHNLGPLGRAEHRFKTHGRVGVRQPAPGLYVWRTRFGRTLVIDGAGTHDLGTGYASDTVWLMASGKDGGRSRWGTAAEHSGARARSLVAVRRPTAVPRR